MNLDHYQGGIPTNLTLWKQIGGVQHDAAMVRSIIGNCTKIKFTTHKPMLTSESNRDFRVSVGLGTIRFDLPLYRTEVTYTEDIMWGAEGRGAEQLAYSLCRLILGNEEWAKKVYISFYQQEVVKWKRTNLVMTAEEIYDKIRNIAKKYDI